MCALGLRESKLKCKSVKLAISAGNMQANGLLTLFNVVQFIVLPTDSPYLGATGIHSQEWNSGADAKQSGEEDHRESYFLLYRLI